MSNKAYPAFAFLGFILVLIPLPWHLQAWNAGTCLFMMWTALGCLIHFINSIVWDGNLELHSTLWCDISSKLIVGLSVGLPCATLCINRRLYAIASISQVCTTRAEKLRIVYIDLAIGIGFPIVVMALHYIVQGHRFDIFEDIGCWPSTFNTPPAYPLVWMWPTVIGSISLIYSALSLHALLRRRQEFSQLLATNQSLNMNRYLRLMGIAAVEICTTTPISIYFMHLNMTTFRISPWVSWSNTKWHFSRIDYFPAFLVNSQPLLKLNFALNLWLFPVSAIVFFAFFGLAEEARRNYKRFYHWIIASFRIKPLIQSQQRALTARPVGVTVLLPSMHVYSVDESLDQTPKSHWDDHFLKTTDMGEPDTTPPSQTYSKAICPTHVPALAVTCPQTDSPAISPSTNEQTLPEQRASITGTHPYIFQRSMSTDYGITVSPPFHPVAESPSRHHEETFLSNDTSSEAPRVSESFPHNGIWMTVERSVV